MLRYVIGLGLYSLSLLCSASSDVNTYIPPKAFQYLPLLKQEQQNIFPGFAYPHYFAGLIELESCITLTHKRCWDPTARLSTKRELGIGVFQLTKAFNANGSVRFDTITGLKRSHSEELRELSWANVQQRADLQIRAGLLLSKDNYNQLSMIKDEYQRIAMMDSAFNGGLTSVQKRRQICGLKAHCDPQFWFDNLEKIVVKSTKPLYGRRSAQQINDQHVKDVLLIRMPKYQPHYTP